MKIGEVTEFDGRFLRTKETHDMEPAIRQVERARELQALGAGFNAMRHVATIPYEMLEVWAHEAGIRVSDADAMNEIIRLKIRDPAYGKFRVYQGNI